MGQSENQDVRYLRERPYVDGDRVAAAVKERSPKFNNGRRINVVNQRLGYLVRWLTTLIRTLWIRSCPWLSGIWRWT